MFSDETVHLLAETMVPRNPKQSSLTALGHCFGKLGENHRELVMVRYTRGKSLIEHAESIGTTAESLRVTLHRIRQSLKPDLSLFRISLHETHAIPIANHSFEADILALAAADPLASLLDTDTFGMKTDDLHFDTAGQQSLGKGGANLFLDFEPFTSPLFVERLPGGDLMLTVDDAFEGFLYTLKSSETLAP